MLFIELADRRTDRLDASTGPLGQTARNLRLPPARACETTCPIDDVLPLLFGELAESRTTSDSLLIVLHEAVEAAAQETDSLAAVEHKATTHQAEFAPTRNRLG